MAFEEHREFSPPQGGDAVIWRYMDLSKFLSLIDKSALCFVRLDRLSELDPFEGYYTLANLQIDQLSFTNLPPEWKKEGGIANERTWEVMKTQIAMLRQFVKANRAVTFVSSWHAQEHESAAMWKQYLKSDEGIAIQSTYWRLIEAFSTYSEYAIHVGMVRYLDYNRDAIPMGNLLAPFMHKRKSFEHEKELRAVIWTPQHGKNDPTDPERNKYKDVFAFYVPANLDVLIEKIYLAPTAPQWHHDLLSSLVKRFGLAKEVVHSDLASVPVY